MARCRCASANIRTRPATTTPKFEVSFFTPAGRTDFTFTKIDVQFMRRECNRILKELEENK